MKNNHNRRLLLTSIDKTVRKVQELHPWPPALSRRAADVLRKAPPAKRTPAPIKAAEAPPEWPAGWGPLRPIVIRWQIVADCGNTLVYRNAVTTNTIPRSDDVDVAIDDVVNELLDSIGPSMSLALEWVIGSILRKRRPKNKIITS